MTRSSADYKKHGKLLDVIECRNWIGYCYGYKEIGRNQGEVESSYGKTCLGTEHW